MKPIRTSLIKRAALVVALAGGGLLAASSFATPAGSPRHGECAGRHEQSAANFDARRTQRLAELKAKLKLSPEQETAWNAFAGARQPAMMHGVDRQARRAEFEKLTTPQRLDKMQAMSDMRRARLAERAAATKAFYAQLSPEQQSVFDAESKLRLHRHGHDQHRHGHNQGNRQS